MRVFITGITGTLGTALAKLHYSRLDAVWGCSRSEPTAAAWVAEHGRIATHFLCDAAQVWRNGSDIARLLPSMDRLYHCAAMKHVDICEQNPIQAMDQNVLLTNLVAVACRTDGVQLVHISSDKACLPQGIYGATKFLAERIALREGGAVVRLGNLVGSSGSVFALWQDAAKDGRPIKLTDPDMTRYFVGVDAAAEFVANRHTAGRIVVPRKLKAVRMGHIADEMGCEIEVIGRRPGETQHQWLVAPEEPMTEDGDRILLGGDIYCHKGMCSDTAVRWDPDELMHVAGIAK